MLKKKYKKIFYLLLLIFLFTFSVVLFFLNNKKIEVYGIKYGDSFYHSKNIYYEDKFGKPLPFSWMFYVIKYKNKIILIDTGFNNEALVESLAIDYKDPLYLLSFLNINSDKVTDLILTHSHFDHIGNADKFKNAKIYIQREELEHFKRNSKDKKLLNFFENNDKLVLFDDYYNLYNFFEIKKIGGHTIGSSIVLFKHNNIEYVITGDECYLIDNCDGNPIGTYYNIKKNRDFISWVKENENIRILPLHDNKIFNIYPVVNNFIAKII